jgi:hypothetical protein
MMKWGRRLGVLVGAVTLVSGCNSGECQDGGRTYEDGQSWTCGDGCNTCGCRDGEVSQTAIACFEPNVSAAGKLKCFDDDVWHMHGDTWTTDSGCTHSCDDGQLVGDCR